ncbi:MAG TPA: phospholipase [Polyangia bacterium]|nr:phospholipase [Polyangia bacterium]
MKNRRFILAPLVVALAALSVGALDARRPWASRLATITRGGEGPPTLVLLHGYGSKAADWEPFTGTLAVPAHTHFVFPEAPETTVPPDGPVGGRAWWRLDLEDHIGRGRQLPDLSGTHPPGLDTSAALVHALLRDLSRAPGGPVVLGGFSQGAMVASDLAFTTDDDVAALVLLSGTPVDEATWRRGFARRRGLRVFISHGRADPVLPFAAAERLQRELAEAGLVVTWVPFDGGHEITAQVVAALNAFLAPVLATK